MGLTGLVDFFISELRTMKIHRNTPDDIYNIIMLNTLYQISDVLCNDEKIIVQEFINKRLLEKK